MMRKANSVEAAEEVIDEADFEVLWDEGWDLDLTPAEHGGRNLVFDLGECFREQPEEPEECGFHDEDRTIDMPPEMVRPLLKASLEE